MGDRHGGRFARRGRALNPPRPQVDTHRGVRFRWRAVNFRWRGVVVRICPHARTLSSAKASRNGARAKGFAPRRNAPTAKASRHGARAKRFVPRGNALLGESLPTQRASERICPRENAPLGEGLSTRRTSERICPAGFAFAPRADERRAALCRCPDRKTPLRRGRTRDGAAAAEFIHRKK